MTRGEFSLVSSAREYCVIGELSGSEALKKMWTRCLSGPACRASLCGRVLAPRGGRRRWSITCDRCFIGRVATQREMKPLTGHTSCVVNRWCCRCASFDTAGEDVHMGGPVNRIPSPKLLDTRPKLVESCTLHFAVAYDTRIIVQNGVGFLKLHLPWGPG